MWLLFKRLLHHPCGSLTLKQDEQLALLGRFYADL